MELEVGEFLQEITDAAGVSGFEGGVAALIRQVWEPLADDIRRDNMGSLMARRGPRPGAGAGKSVRVMMAAHMDEIGLMVTKIEKGGFLRFAPVGGFDRRVLPAQEVVVHGRESLPGVIGVKPPHLLSAEAYDKPYKPEDMYIDVGLSEEEAGRLVQVGDPITMKGGFRRLQGEMAANKGMDDRAGVAVLHVCLQELACLQHSH
ncbi:MAG TPA: M42 family metallopeptidase, partial [Firmicutes bacterium]|nr:M42 family metallopeptidase [Bacillota bacterium]